MYRIKLLERRSGATAVASHVKDSHPLKQAIKILLFLLLTAMGLFALNTAHGLALIQGAAIGSINVTKNADVTEVPEPGGEVTFTVEVENTSATATVTINSVVDDMFGDVSASCFPALPATLAITEKTVCTFTETISGVGGDTHLNVATASGVDDDGNLVMGSDNAAVDITINTGVGTIVIVKDTVADAPRDFAFTTTGSLSPATFSLDDDGNNDNTFSNTQTYPNVPAGSYTVSETAVAGYSTSISCVDPTNNSTGSGPTANIDLAAGETVTCTFTNTDQQTPDITPPDDITVEAPTDTSPSNTGTATATDNSGADPAITFSDVVVPGSCAGDFTITRTWKATDGRGNTAATDQFITSQDTTNPILTVPPDVTINQGDSTDPSNTGIATATDAGSGPPTISWSDVNNSNVITRTWMATDGCGNQASAVQTITIASVDLEINISESVDPVVAGANGGNNNLVHTITVKNNGPSTATNIVIQFGASAVNTPSLTFIDGVHSSIGNEWNIASLAAGNTATMLMTFDIASDDSFGSASSGALLLSVDQTDTEGSNDSDAETTTVTYDVQFTLTKDDGDPSPVPGQVIIYILSAINYGISDALGAVFTDSVPIHTTFNAANSSPQWSCSEGDPAGTVCTFDFSAVPGTIGTIGANGGVGNVTFAVTINPVPPQGGSGEIINNAGVLDNNSGATATASETTSVATLIYLSSTTNGSINPSGPSFTDADILVFNPADGSWALYFDGSDVGLEEDVDGVLFLDDGSILLTVEDSTSLPGLGTVKNTDIVRFVPTSVGPTTAGSFEWFLDGSDVGLNGDDEAIEGIARSNDGRLVIATNEYTVVPGAVAQDEDLLVFNATSFGANSTGTWELYFDGSDVSLAGEELECVWVGAQDNLYFAPDDYLSLPGGLNVDHYDLFRFAATSLGNNTAGTFADIFFDGVANGFADEKIDGCAIGEVPPITAGGVCTAPEPATITDIEVSGAGNDVMWTGTADSFELWWGENDPYFTPGSDCSSAANCELVAGSANNYLHNVTNDSSFTYIVVGVNSCGSGTAVSDPSNRYAAFAFPLQPGTP